MSNTSSTTYKPALSSSSGINIINPSSANDDGVDSGASTTKAANLSKWLFQDIDFIEESLEAIKRKACEMISEVHKERKKLEKLVLLDEGGTTEGRDTQLKEVKTKVRKLRLDIPFKFINPPQPLNPNVHWRPRPDPSHTREITLRDLIVQKKRKPLIQLSQEEEYSTAVQGLGTPQHILLLCCLQFPPNAIIKRSIFYRWMTAYRFYTTHSSAVKNFNEDIDCLIEKGFIETVQKKFSLTVAGYRMDHSTHNTLRQCLWPRIYQLWEGAIYLGPCTDKEEEEDYDVFYTGSSSGGQFFASDHEQHFARLLHLGKWKKSSTQHIEFIDNPDLFFQRHVRNLSQLRYISLRGISMIEELPKIITKIDTLVCLDVQACYNLEVIPSDIANLSDSLRHLDMSECYFLEHMPKALATLYSLQILKGFFVGEVVDERSCTLEDLSLLPNLEKLNIYTSAKTFPSTSQLKALQKFKSLRSLTISWGGCKSSPKDKHGEFRQSHNISSSSSSGVETSFWFDLVKLDLQCVPGTVSSQGWLNPANFRELKRLYIRGGGFSDLGQWSEEERERWYCWDVEILRLKHLGNLKMEWAELGRLFPRLICLEKVDCPQLHGVPHDKDGVWTKEADLHPSRSA